MKSKVMVSAIDQGLISAFNFGLNLILIKFWTPALFGVYSILFTLSFVFIGLQNALINTPYSVLVPARKRPHSTRRTLAISNLLFLLAMTLVLTMLQALPWLSQQYAPAALITAFFIIRLLREYLRCRWASELILGPVLLSDILFVGLFAIAGGGLWWQGGPLNLEQLLWLLCITQLASLVYLIQKEMPLLKPLSWRRLLGGYAPIWRQSRWSLVGVATTELQNRGYIFVVGLLFGSSMVGFIQAGRVFFGPLNIITTAWTRVAKPVMARLHGKHRLQEFQQLVNRGLVGFLVFNLLFGAALWLAWPLLEQHLFSDQYQGVGLLTFQWALVTLLFHLRSTASAAIQAQNRFKLLAKATLWGALFSLTSLAIISFAGSSDWLVVSVILGEAVAFAYIFRLLQNPGPVSMRVGVADDL